MIGRGGRDEGPTKAENRENAGKPSSNESRQKPETLLIQFFPLVNRLLICFCVWLSVLDPDSELVVYGRINVRDNPSNSFSF